MLTLATHSQPFYHLLVIEDRKAKRIVSLEKYVYSLGRHLSNAIIIDDHQVSRHHATLLRLTNETDGHFYKIIDGSLEGSKSTNGVFVNGRPCLSHPLKHGDLIEFGSRAKAFYLVVSQELAFNLVQLGQTAPIDDYASEKEFKITLTSEEDEQYRQADLVRLASFPELSPNPIIEIDWEGNIIYLNPIASIKFAEIYQTKEHPLLAGLLNRSLQQQGSLFVREVKVGQEAFEQHVHYLSDSRIIRSYLFNVTEYRQAEAARRESEQRFRNAFEFAAIGICLVSPEGKFLLVNSSVCQILGYSKSELLNLTYQDITHPDDRELDESYVQQLLAGEIDHYHLEKRYFHQQGNVIWVKLSVSLVRDEEAKPLYAISQIQNITEQKQTQQQLLQLNEQLSQFNSELKQFADTSSHELREPLRKIKSYIERLDAADEDLAATVNEVTKMQNLVGDLSVYSQAIACELVVEPTDLNAVLEQVLHALESLIHKNNAQILAQPLPTVMAHRSQMTQLLHNLIHNSLKFRSYADPVIEVSAKRQEEQWLIGITDNGIGIDSKYAGRVFEIFQRLHSRSQYEGTGIGLSVCQKILERHGGKIWLESERGKGTTFYFTLNEPYSR